MRFKKKDMIREILEGEETDENKAEQRRASMMERKSISSEFRDSNGPAPWTGRKKRMSMMMRDTIFNPGGSGPSARNMEDSSLNMVRSSEERNNKLATPAFARTFIQDAPYFLSLILTLFAICSAHRRPRSSSRQMPTTWQTLSVATLCPGWTTRR